MDVCAYSFLLHHAKPLTAIPARPRRPKMSSNHLPYRRASHPGEEAKNGTRREERIPSVRQRPPYLDEYVHFLYDLLSDQRFL